MLGEHVVHLRALFRVLRFRGGLRPLEVTAPRLLERLEAEDDRVEEAPGEWMGTMVRPKDEGRG